MNSPPEQIHDLPLVLIHVGERHRKDLGAIDELSESIGRLGLLQPIGVDPNYRLIFGARRMAAFERLGLPLIPARIIPIDDLLEGEHAENLIRKEFTVSERVAIGRSMAVRLGERQGQRTDLEPVQDFAQVETGQKTRDLAAGYAGFGGHSTYALAEKVCSRRLLRAHRTRWRKLELLGRR